MRVGINWPRTVRISCLYALTDFLYSLRRKKQQDCGVFGVSSDEYLNYAIKNRKEWESRGQEVVADMIEKVNAPATEG